MSSYKISMNNYWNSNIEILARHRPRIFKLIQARQTAALSEFLRETACGDVSLALPNQQQNLVTDPPVDPWQEAAVHLEIIPPDATGLAVFVGMGLGYGPLLVQRKRPDLAKIVILEPSLELFITALQAVDLSSLLESAKINFHIGDINFDDFEKNVEQVAAVDDTSVLRYLPAFSWQPELYGNLSNRAYDLLNRINVAGSTTSKMGADFFKNRFANLTLLRHQNSLDAIKGIFAEKPAVLVAAGPSLNQSLATLGQLADRCVIIAVDSALSPLLRHNIIPDFVTTLDMVNMNFEKIAPFVGQNWPFSLVSVAKGTPMIPKRLAARHHFFAFHRDLPQLWMMEALDIRTIVPPGFAVSQLSLGLALAIGADPIIFIGQDLAYTADDSDHAAGTVIAGKAIPASKEKLPVQGINGRQLVTTRDMLGQKKITEDIISASPANYINATVAGAHIEGTTVLNLAQAGRSYMHTDFDAGAIIDAALVDACPMDVNEFVDQGRRILCKVNLLTGKVRKSLQAVNQLSAKLKKNKKMLAVNDFAGLPPELKKRFVVVDRLSKELDSEDYIWEQMLELTHGLLRENELRQTKNQDLLSKKSFVAWLQAELKRVAWINNKRLKYLIQYKTELGRVIAHLEREEKLLNKKSISRNIVEDLLLLYRQSEDYRLAVELVEQVSKQPSPEICIAIAEIYGALLDFDSADRWWQKVSFAEKWQKKVQKSRMTQAEQWLATANDFLDPEDPDLIFPQLLEKILTRTARLLVTGCRTPESLQKLWKKYSPKIMEWISSGNYELAADVLTAWQKVADIIPEINSMLARLLLTTGHYDQGLAALNEAVKMDPSQALLWEEIGDALSDSGDFSGAIAAYEQCFLALPDKMDMLWKMGDNYLRTEKNEAAREAYMSALKKKPGCREAEQGLHKLQTIINNA